MSRPVIGRGMFGMGGAFTDPGEITFSQAVAKLGVDIGNSPYQYYQFDQIANDFNAAPGNAIRLLWGSSLGANNCPVVSHYTNRIIHGAWGFQASMYGAQVGFAANVLFAHEVYNPNITLGAYEWTKAAGNHVTNVYVSKRYDFHPGETSEVMAMFLREMKRVIDAAQAGVTA